MFRQSTQRTLVLSLGLSLMNSQAQQNCPSDIPDNSTLGTGGHTSVTTFRPNANITVYIDVNSFPNNGTLSNGDMYAGISQALSAWATYQKSLGGSLTIKSALAPPNMSTATSANPIVYITKGANPQSKPGGTTFEPGADGYVDSAKTTFDPNWADTANQDPTMVPFIAGLESHEIAQPWGFGDCAANQADCANSVACDNNPTQVGPSNCDKLQLQAIRAKIAPQVSPAAPGGYTGTGSTTNGWVYVTGNSGVDLGLAFSMLASASFSATSSIVPGYYPVLDSNGNTVGAYYNNGTPPDPSNPPAIIDGQSVSGTQTNSDGTITFYSIYVAPDGTTYTSTVTPNADGSVASGQEIYSTDGSVNSTVSIANTDGSYTTVSTATNPDGTGTIASTTYNTDGSVSQSNSIINADGSITPAPSDGSDGSGDGTNGSNGSDGSNGSNGSDGSNGSNGSDGSNGSNNGSGSDNGGSCSYSDDPCYCN